MKMKRITLLTVAIWAAVSMSAAPKTAVTAIKASDSRITYIGRTEVKDGNVSFDWTGVYTKVRFQGNSLSFKVSDTKKNYYNVWLDGSMDTTPDKVVAVHGTDTTIVIYSAEELKTHFGKDKKAAKAPHQVILQKRTEGEQGVTTISEFITDGEFLQADAPKSRIIEYVGDSYTCGYGTESSNKERFKPETENQNLTYACAAARYFDADQIVVAHSGMGIVRNYNSKFTDYCMPERYIQTFDSVKDSRWDAKACGLKPDITVIYLGTNDFSRGMQPAERLFVKNYIKLMKEVKENYGEDHPILCMVPKHDFLMFEYVRKVLDDCGLKNIHILNLTQSVHNNVEDMGADGHPNYNGHLKIAHTVIPYISTITGWELTGNPIK